MTKFIINEWEDSPDLVITYNTKRDHWSFSASEDETQALRAALLDMFADESRRHIGHHIPPETVVEKTATALGFTVTFLKTTPPPRRDDIPPGAIS